MKLRDWLASMKELVETNPGAMDMDIVIQGSECYEDVGYGPSLGTSTEHGIFDTAADPSTADTICLN